MSALPRVDVAMSVLNGGKYLDEMLASLVAQTYKNWRLLVWNDGSTDDTAAILASWQARHPDLIEVLDNPGNINLGLCGGFTRVLQETTAPYIMVADQDDVWFPEKIECSLSGLCRAQSEYGQNVPLLVYTDMTVVDQNGKIIAPSYFEKAGFRHVYELHEIIFRSIVAGPTITMTRSLLELALPAPLDARSHDWWFAVTASAFGQIIALPERTMLYRRHGANESELCYLTFHERLNERLGGIWKTLTTPSAARERLYELLLWNQRIAAATLEQFGDRLTPNQRKMLHDFVQLRNLPPLRRRWAIIRHGLWFENPIVNIGYLLLA